MSKAVADPNEMRRFAQDLKRFTNTQRDQLAAVQARLNDLGQTWRDQEHAKFAGELEQHMRTFARLNDAVDRYVQFLLRKADKVDEYLQQR
jgi:uncharacterized protein YukE